MENPEQFPQEQQTNIPETEAHREQEVANHDAAVIAVHGIASHIRQGLAGATDLWANKIERKVEVTEHIHDLHHGRVGDAPVTDQETSAFDVSTMTRRERRRAMKSVVKAQDAEWDRKTAERKESANRGKGRVPRRTKRSLSREVEDRALTGEMSLKEMQTNKELIKLGGHVIVDGEPRKISKAKPVRTVVRAHKRADVADKRSLRVIDTSKQEGRIADKRDKADEHRRQAEYHREQIELRRRDPPVEEV